MSEEHLSDLNDCNNNLVSSSKVPREYFCFHALLDCDCGDRPRGQVNVQYPIMYIHNNLCNTNNGGLHPSNRTRFFLAVATTGTDASVGSPIWPILSSFVVPRRAALIVSVYVAYAWMGLSERPMYPPAQWRLEMAILGHQNEKTSVPVSAQALPSGLLHDNHMSVQIVSGWFQQKCTQDRPNAIFGHFGPKLPKMVPNQQRGTTTQVGQLCVAETTKSGGSQPARMPLEL